MSNSSSGDGDTTTIADNNGSMETDEAVVKGTDESNGIGEILEAEAGVIGGTGVDKDNGGCGGEMDSAGVGKSEQMGDTEKIDPDSEDLLLAPDEGDSDVDINLSLSSSSDTEAQDQEVVPQAKKRRMDAGIKAIQHHQTLKKSLEPFFQHKACDKLENTYGFGKCMECKVIIGETKQKKKGKDGICRFLAFRKLRYTKKGTRTVAGFPSPVTDPSQDDLNIWMPVAPPEGMSFELAKYLLEEVGDQFCELVQQEKETLRHLPYQEDQRIIWRKTVKNLRELCDVCSTTLFNFHWTCGRCGFVVCVSCFHTRRIYTSQDKKPVLSVHDPRKDGFGWLKCHIRSDHALEKLMLTQIIAGNVLDDLACLMHRLRQKLKIPQSCDCSPIPEKDDNFDLEAFMSYQAACNDALKKSVESKNASEAKESSSELSKTNSQAEDDSEEDSEQDEILDLFGDDDSDEEENKPEEGKEDSKPEERKEEAKLGEAEAKEDSTPEETKEDTKPEEVEAKEKKPEEEAQEDIIDAVEPSTKSTLKEQGQASFKGDISSPVPLKVDLNFANLIHKGRFTYKRKNMPKRALSAVESRQLYPNVEHTWLCEGNLLRLLEPTNPNNSKIFQEQWKRGQPVLVSNVSSNLDENLWTPSSFSRDFGHKSNKLINCLTGKTVPAQRMKKFWDGFELMKQRLRDENGTPMLLKLKDWPPGHDFADLSPNRFKDLMSALPLTEYTSRYGKLNLASRLPEIFSRPDLGPKMYIAYGSGLHLDKGTTNLHLDVSDAVNVMVHVGVVKDDDVTEHTRAVVEAIEESDCDNSTIRRVRSNQALPGALWHIWEARDADKIRDMINKEAIRRGLRLERHHDAIHDQSWYLDRSLRKILMEEYNVIGYPIVQCAGDAVFIPAGAPHQVRNLNNCIKIAEDFVSPENVGHCFHLTEEFRNLSETHSNHEDKLQIKNIVYHTVKDAVAVINAALQTFQAKNVD